MKKANLPVEKASEPNEEARQPLKDDRVENSTMAPIKKKAEKNIKFAESETNDSQTSSNYKEALSQPPSGLTHRQKLLWLQKRRGVGLWAQCDDCNKWRFLPDVLERHELPEKWFCRMNKDKSMAECSIPEAPLRVKDEEDLIHNEYTTGSLVWAKYSGWPWWPAMVDDDPDTEQYYWLDGFSDIPTDYHVVFFDEPEVTRAWISPNKLKPYTSHKKKFRHVLKNKKYKERITKAVTQADEATEMTVTKRLARFSFIAKYRGLIMSPKKFKNKVLRKFQEEVHKELNIEIPTDWSLESEEENEVSGCGREDNKRKNVVVATPKTKRQKKQVVAKNRNVIDADKKAPVEKKATVYQRDSEKKNEVPADVRVASVDQMHSEKRNEGVFQNKNVILVETPNTESQNNEVVAEKLNTVADKTASCGEKSTINISNQENIAEHGTMIMEEARKQSSLDNYIKEHNKYMPKKLCQIIENTIDILEESVKNPTYMDISHATPNETNNQSTEMFKEPNSMAAQPGSLNDTLFINHSKDLSIDYQGMGTESMVVPDSQTQSEMDTNTNDDPDFDIRRAPSPSSDDFEF